MSLQSQLNLIHKQVLKGFTYVSDKEQFGEIEYWVNHSEGYGGEPIEGDCDDFAMACRALCRLENIPTRLVYCLTEEGEGHLVAESEGWILDNRQKKVRSRDNLDYTWIRISGFEPGDDWHEIEI